MYVTLFLLFLTLCLWHLCEGDDHRHHDYHQSDGNVRITDDGQIVYADAGLLGLRQREEDNLSGLIAAVAP